MPIESPRIILPVPGDMVTIKKKQGTTIIQARRKPKRTTYADYDVTHAREVVVDDNLVCTIPDGVQALYIGNELVQYRLGSCHRIGSDDVTYHLVFWNGTHAWVSSEEATIERTP